MGKPPRIGTVGYTVTDYSFKIDSFKMLPQLFSKYAKRSIPFSKISSLFGKGWKIEKVKENIVNLAREPSSAMFSGRAINIGYQFARLGGPVELITEVGEDFYQPSSASQYSYANHLEKVGISTCPFTISFSRRMETINPERVRKQLLRTYGDQLLSSGILMVSGTRTASVISLSDQTGTDIFFFDDIHNASKIAKFRPTPIGLVEKLDGIVVSSGDNGFNQLVVKTAYERGLDIFFDVGLFEPYYDYLRSVVTRSTIVFGNRKEMGEVCRSFGFSPDHPEQIFSRAKTSRLKYIVIVEKEKGKVSILKRDAAKPFSVGPVLYKKTGTGIGVCDAITGGTIALFLRGYPIEICCRGGLIAGGAVWESDKIQEPMIDWRELNKRYMHQFDETL